MSEKLLDREKTIFIKSNLDREDFIIDNDNCPEKLINFIYKMSEGAIFADGIIELCLKHGFDGDADNINAIQDYIVSNALKCGVVKGRKEQNIFRTNVGNWLKEGRQERKRDGMTERINAPDDNIRSRNNVYKLCFSLSLGIDEIEEFFLKKYLCRPFNMRNIDEAIYWFVLKNNWDYSTYRAIKEKIENKEYMLRHGNVSACGNEMQNMGSHSKTASFQKEMMGDGSIENFVDYCVSNYDYFAQNNKTAVNQVKELLEECYANMQTTDYRDECELGKSIDRISCVLDVIYGTKLEDEKQTTEQLLRKLRNLAPKRIYTRFPSATEIRKVVKMTNESEESKNEKVSSEVLRRTIILLYFYVSVTIWESSGNGEFYKEYIDGLDNMLNQCGFIQSYAGNPYDWIFMYCAKQEDPLEAFYILINRFTKMEDKDM